MQAVFSGLKIVEFASVLAGPAVGMFFSELGAEVTKIENKTTGGDITRGWKLPSEDPGSPISAYFCSVNWGKQHLLLDLNQADELAQARQLTLQADVVISNFQASAIRRFGLDAASLQAENPRLVYAHLHAYPDPADERPAFDVVLQAEAGFLYMNGEPDRPPVKMPVALIDVLAAHQLKEAILIALLLRERTGKGMEVSVSLFDSALASLANQATNYLMAGHIPRRMGARHPNIAPYGDMFTTADGQAMLLAVGTERQFGKLCSVLDLGTLPEDERFCDNTARVRNRERLVEVLATAIRTFPLEELMDRLNKAGVPAGRIRDMESVFTMPEAQAMLLSEDVGGLPTQRVRTVAFQLKEA